MSKTVVGLFNTLPAAQNTVEELVRSGFARDGISIIANDASGELARYDSDSEEIAEDVGTGALLGGLAGLVVGIAALAIPGVGPVLAAGPIAATLAGAGLGAMAGGLLSALSEMGVPETEAEYYAEGVRRGGALVTVMVEDDTTASAVTIMERHGAMDIEHLAARWQESGWARFDEHASPYSSVDIANERQQYDSGNLRVGSQQGAASKMEAVQPPASPDSKPVRVYDPRR